MKKQTTTFPDIKKGLDDDAYPSMNARGEEAVSNELYDRVKLENLNLKKNILN